MVIFTFIDESLDVHEHVRKRCDLFAVFEQLRQVVGDALRVHRIDFRHFHVDNSFCRVTTTCGRTTPAAVKLKKWYFGFSGRSCSTPLIARRF